MTARTRRVESDRKEKVYLSDSLKASASFPIALLLDVFMPGALTSLDLESPEVSESSVASDLLESLEVLSHLLVDLVRDNVGVLAVGDVLLPVEEPGGDLELRRVLHDGHDSLELVRVELSGPVIERV